MEKQTLKSKQLKELNHFITNSATPGPAVRRAQAVLLLCQAMPVPAIEQITSFGKEHIFRLRRHYGKLGLKAFRDKRQGEPKPLLTKRQRQEILTLLKTKTSAVAGYAGAGWTTNMLGDWVERRYRILAPLYNSLRRMNSATAINTLPQTMTAMLQGTPRLDSASGTTTEARPSKIGRNPATHAASRPACAEASATQAGFGGAFAAIVGTATCASCLAFLFGIVGLGIGSVAFVLKYQTFFLLGAIALVLGSLYFTARKINKACNSC